MACPGGSRRAGRGDLGGDPRPAVPGERGGEAVRRARRAGVGTRIDKSAELGKLPIYICQRCVVMARAGRPRQVGPRFPGGKLRLHKRPFPGKSAVYVIELSPGLIKIGRSQNPQQRIDELMTGREHPAALICCFWMDEAIAKTIERRVHKGLQKTSAHARAEMYYLDVETAIAVIKATIGKRDAKMVGIERFGPDVRPVFPPRSGQARRWGRRSARGRPWFLT
jgi:Meiotically up-regulated gene 113